MEFTLRFVQVFVADLLYASPVLVCLLLLIALIGLSIGRIEGWSRFDALYHAFINATTVGLVFTGMVVAVALHAANYAYSQVYDTSGFRDR